MKHKLTISVSVLYPLLQTAQLLGVNPDLLLSDCGMNANIFSSPDNRFTLDEYDRLIKKAVELCCDDLFGLHLGKNFNIGTGNIASYMMLNCANLREAGEKYIAYQKIVGEGIIIGIDVEKENAIIRYKIASNDIKDNRHILEAMAVNIFETIKGMIVSDWTIKEIHFNSEQPEKIEEYKHIFGCPLKWNQSVSAIIFDKKFLEAPLKQPNKELLEILENRANIILKKLNSHETYADKVSRILQRLLNGTSPRIEQVAAEIPMSLRNLQIKLKQENTSFQKILEDVRKNTAMLHLKDGVASISEIAYMLGYSEPGVFQKAFKNWTGLTPGQYRLKQTDLP